MVDDAFWLRYLRAHADPRTRRIHAAGTILATAVTAAALVKRDPKIFAAALVCGYAPAWYAHAFVERNKPETFSAPLRSLASDYAMCWRLLTGTLDPELQRAGVASTAAQSARNASLTRSKNDFSST
ncbi:MAG TPA: DUF962 domain-containing protein [Candidatus Baltobacteraceae bacterium]|nr:DUF962 domain-containing protein [Candidatus Baltobacteraceae bacterium]